MIKLGEDPARVARCVEVGILTVTRSQEIRLMEWSEIDFDERTWLIPAAKMKVKKDSEQKPKDHLVPLPIAIAEDNSGDGVWLSRLEVDAGDGGREKRNRLPGTVVDTKLICDRWHR